MGKRFVPFILSLIIVFSSITVFGERIFTDVADDHWAYFYIKKVIDLGLMDGYDDATFRPNDVVNTVDALVYITRLVNVEEEEAKSLREDYDGLLDNYQLTEEDKNSIAIALDRGFIGEDFIRDGLFNEGEIKKATKLEISKYMAKALGFEAESYDKSLIFSYQDARDIPESEKPYVKFLIDEEILDAKGDENRNFNPNQNITRAILAKMLAGAYDAISDKSIIQVERIDKPKDTVEPEKLEEVGQIEDIDFAEELGYEKISGTILMILNNLVVIDTGDKIDSYSLTEDTKVIVDGESTDIKKLEEDIDVSLLIYENKSIERIEVESNTQVVHGVVNKIYLGDNPYLNVGIDDGYTKTFELSKNPEVVLDGRDSYLFSLNEGDKVRIEALEDTALFITGESKEGIITGILRDKIIDEEESILIERENGSIYEYNVNQESIINRDRNEVGVEDLRAFDELILTIRDGEVYRVDAYSVPGKDTGHIRTILISDEPVLTIEKEDGTLESYYISKRVKMTKDNNILNIYDLRLGDIVDLDLESDEIVNLKVVTKIEAED